MKQPELVSVGQHPRSGPAIRRAKAWGGLAGFVLTGAGSLMNGALPFDALLRAVGGGVVSYLLVWAVAVTVWRHVLQAEAKAVVVRAAEERRRAAAERS